MSAATASGEVQPQPDTEHITASLGLNRSHDGRPVKRIEPRGRMRWVVGKKVNYAYGPKKAGAKLDDVLIWISYLTNVDQRMA